MAGVGIQLSKGEHEHEDFLGTQLKRRLRVPERTPEKGRQGKVQFKGENLASPAPLVNQRKQRIARKPSGFLPFFYRRIRLDRLIWGANKTD